MSIKFKIEYMKDGKQVKGELVAANEDEARRKLTVLGYKIVSIAVVPDGKQQGGGFWAKIQDDYDKEIEKQKIKKEEQLAKDLLKYESNPQMKAFREKVNKIAVEYGDDMFFTRKEIDHLPEVLREGEEVLAFSSGIMNGNTWLVTLTNKRILFLDKGMLYGLKQIAIDLDKVNAVSCEEGLVLGKIVITDGAGDHRIENVLKRTVNKFTNKVQETIEARKTVQQGPPQASKGKQEDVYDKLEKLASLKEKKIVTEEEFEKEKKKLLQGGD